MALSGESVWLKTTTSDYISLSFASSMAPSVGVVDVLHDDTFVQIELFFLFQLNSSYWGFFTLLLLLEFRLSENNILLNDGIAQNIFHQQNCCFKFFPANPFLSCSNGEKSAGNNLSISLCFSTASFCCGFFLWKLVAERRMSLI